MTAVDYEGRKEAFVQHPDTGRYNLVATFPTPNAAARAMQELRGRGFPEADVRLIGASEDAVVSGMGLTEPDARLVKSTFHYGILGTAGGAVLGAIVGVIVMAIPAFQSAIGVHVDAGTYLLAAAFGAIAGSVLGLAGGMLGMERPREGVQTHDAQLAGGPTVVGVHTEDEQHTRTATSALHDAGASNVEWLHRDQKIVV